MNICNHKNVLKEKVHKGKEHRDGLDKQSFTAVERLRRMATRVMPEDGDAHHSAHKSVCEG